MGRIEQIQRTQDQRAAHSYRITAEQSTLPILQLNFPTFKGKRFNQWMEEFDRKGDLRVLEYGGGSQQRVAKDALSEYDGITDYVAYEAIPFEQVIDGEGLSSNPTYKYISGGLEDLHGATGDADFTIAFAHKVAHQVAHPLGLFEKLYERLDQGGLVFVNDIIMHADVADELIEEWTKSGYRFATSMSRVGGNFKNAGVVSLGVAMEKTFDSVVIPQVTDQFLSGNDGTLYPTLTYKRLADTMIVSKPYPQEDIDLARCGFSKSRGEYVKYLIETEKINDRARENTDDSTGRITIYDAIAHAENQLKDF